MKLTGAQLETFQREGYLFLPQRFSAEEVGVLLAELPGIFAIEPLADDCLLELARGTPASA